MYVHISQLKWRVDIGQGLATQECLPGTLYILLYVCSPFSVIPSNIALEVGASMQMDINFTPHRVGDHRGQITVHYHTGEDVVIETYGGSMDANIRIDRNTVKMENTYINMSSHR